MAKCSFCGNVIAKGTGLLYVKKDGKTFSFCKTKCKKNQLELKRKPATTKWTKRYQKK